MSITEVYQYEPLEDSPSSFRLLRLLPIRSSVIACRLINSSLSTCEPYEALSYTWGSDEKVETTTVNDRALDITDNLYAALKDLALPDKERLLWIDGICIDQSNNAEKSLQVQLKLKSLPTRFLRLTIKHTAVGDVSSQTHRCRVQGQRVQLTECSLDSSRHEMTETVTSITAMAGYVLTPYDHCISEGSLSRNIEWGQCRRLAIVDQFLVRATTSKWYSESCQI
jgi:hypothetical protein